VWYRAKGGTSLIRKRLFLGPYSSPMPLTLWRSADGTTAVLQGYLAHKKPPPPQLDPRHSPAVGSPPCRQQPCRHPPPSTLHPKPSSGRGWGERWSNGESEAGRDGETEKDTKREKEIGRGRERERKREKARERERHREREREGDRRNGPREASHQPRKPLPGTTGPF